MNSIITEYKAKEQERNQQFKRYMHNMWEKQRRYNQEERQRIKEGTFDQIWYRDT